MSTPNKTKTLAADGQVIVGITKDLQNVSQLPLDGDTYTPTSLVAFVQARIDAAHKIDTARAAYLDAVKVYDALNTKTTRVLRGLRNYVIGLFGELSPKMADFGFTPSPRATQTTAQKAAAAAKRMATRKARGTMGKKAKLKITGATPTAAPPVVPAPASPAPAPGNGTTTAQPAAPAASPPPKA